MAKFRRKPFLIHARRVRDSEEMVRTFGSNLMVKPGDWVLGMENERQSVCHDLVFRELYEPVDDEAKKELEDESTPGCRG